jgi:hypothetical protein
MSVVTLIPQPWEKGLCRCRSWERFQTATGFRSCHVPNACLSYVRAMNVSRNTPRVWNSKLVVITRISANNRKKRQKKKAKS